MDNYNFVLVIGFTVVILGIFLGVGENRKIVIYKDFDDLGLSFLMPASFLLISLIFQWIGGDQGVATIIGGLVALILLVKLTINTYAFNDNQLWKTALALLTKIPLALIWVFSLTNALNPQGTGRQRRQARGQALAILALLTPIIALLVVDRSGSHFNPRRWIRGRRVGSSIRNNL